MDELQVASFDRLRPGCYMVLRWFGRNHLFYVVDRPVMGRRGQSVRAVKCVFGRSDVSGVLLAKKLGVPASRLGSPIYEWFFTTKFRPVRWLRPRWHGFYDRRAAREYMRENRSFGALDLLAKVVCGCLPSRAAGIVLGVVVGFVLAFTPLHFQILREHLESMDAL